MGGDVGGVGVKYTIFGLFSNDDQTLTCLCILDKL